MFGDNQDCCCLQALCKKAHGTWDAGAVKHGMIGSIGYPRVSVLYTAKKYVPDLSDSEDAILAKISELVAGDEKRGTIIWDETCYGKSEEELMAILDNLDFSYAVLKE